MVILAQLESRAGQTGLMHVFNVGSTATLGTIEFEPGLQRDLPAILDKLIPPSRDYGHDQPGTMALATLIFRQRCSAHR